MKDFFKKFGIWFEIVFIVFTVILVILSGFSFGYIFILFSELALLFWDWLDKKNSK